MAGTVRVRRDVWKFEEWDPILLWYAEAILDMQQRPLDDPTSWRYQAAVHRYVVGSDPLATAADTLPSSGDRQRFWSQCQHFSWYFLPWHRMYLAYFEQIIASIVADRGGPDDWALPYWNYSDPANPDARRLPPAFRQPALPDGRANPLRIDDRYATSNGGSDIAGDLEVDLGCLTEPLYSGQGIGGGTGFGGPRTGFSHIGSAAGAVERVPHGSIHVAVGGWMQGFNTAGLDPIFWLHHCNIDRLWSVWRERDTQHADPTDSRWLTSLTFDFHDAGGNVVSHSPSQVVDTIATPPLGYEYDDISDPLVPTPGAALERVARRAMDDEATPEMVGATEDPVTLTGQPVSARLAVEQPTGPAARATQEAGAPPSRVYLNIENITGSGEPTSYAVYLNVPPGEDPAQHPELYAGLLPMFGVAEASREDEDHAGSGLSYVLDVGDIVSAVEGREGWDPNDLEVTFVPQRVQPETARLAEATETDAIEVGRISLYYT